MKRIVNWTFGAFFRSIGRTLAFLFLGIILSWLIAKFDIKLPFLTVKAYSFEYLGETENINLPNNDKYFVFGSGFNAVKYTYISSNIKFYYVCNYNFRFNNTYWSCVGRNTKTKVTQEEFNNSNEFKYYDLNNNEYYIFTGNDNFDNWYYSSNGNWWHLPYTNDSLLSTPNIDTYRYDWNGCSLDSMCNFIAAPYNVGYYDITFHLNGGTAIYQIANILPRPSDVHSTDFTTQVYDKNDLNTYLSNLTVKNDLVTFNQWYYDEQLTQPYDPNNEINSNINLYASYEYTSVDSIINNITFNNYTFNTPNDNYQYAVISVKENFNQGLYIGLGFNFQYLDAYKYIIANNAFTEKSYISLNSIGSNNNNYYYHLGGLDNNSAMVIVLDKVNLIKLNANNEIEHYYDFLVSDNCYVYFTNDLTQISYYIPSNNGSSSQLLENKDISSNYDYSQGFMLDSNNDFVTIFINSMKSGDFTIFNIAKNIWYKLRAYKIYNYIFIICLGSIIIAIIKGGARH